jgi:hypothetical protein
MKKLLVGVMLVASPAQGMVYMWSDSAGIAHYTNKEYDIPARYKAKAKSLYPEEADAGKNPSTGAIDQTTPSVPPQAVAIQPQKTAEPPKEQPIATAPQITSTPPLTKSKRERRHRERGTEEE